MIDFLIPTPLIIGLLLVPFCGLFLIKRTIYRKTGSIAGGYSDNEYYNDAKLESNNSDITLNIVFNGRWKIIDNTFNTMNERIDSINSSKITIFHYVGSIKPWSSFKKNYFHTKKITFHTMVKFIII